MFFSILLFVFSAIKGPVKELRLSFMLGENMWTKYFYYFQDLRVLKCHRTKHSNSVNYRSKWPLRKTFSSLIPPPACIYRDFDPPSHENFQNPISRGVWIFLEQSIIQTLTGLIWNCWLVTILFLVSYFRQKRSGLKYWSLTIQGSPRRLQTPSHLFSIFTFWKKNQKTGN